MPRLCAVRGIIQLKDSNFSGCDLLLYGFIVNRKGELQKEGSKLADCQLKW